DLKRNISIEDEFGRPLLAADVFGMSIKFLVDDMLKNANKGIDGIIKPWEIHLVVTVPAKWLEYVKNDEPEAASLYCRHLHIHKPGDLGNVSMNKLPIGTKYIVVDAGGGTIDITVHETGSQQTLREVRPASGDDWGGIMVDKEFEKLLVSLVGQTVFEEFKHTEKEDWLDMLKETRGKFGQ
ncbi:heat shock 70 kDa protein 12A-like, partial [Ruditapes philippinarum]|uniref:heat shock 70 kDa protein 12A-like n=1 Tax=Ruditapes philippinarum TaxID=129788 RepID=UPI00295BD8C5